MFDMNFFRRYLLITLPIFAACLLSSALAFNSFAAESGATPSPPDEKRDIELIKSNLPKEPVFSADSYFASLGDRMQKSFDALLKDPKQYQAIVAKECGVFPEGQLYPYAMPALGYANLAFRDPKQQDHARRQMATLLDLALPQVAKEVQAPAGNLLQLKTYQKHATFLGTLNSALGNYELSTRDKRYSRLHDHLSKILSDAVRSADGLPVQSYPDYSWNFDTIMVLASLDIHDRNRGTDDSKALVKKHLDWIRDNATDAKSGLPYSTGSNASGVRPGVPRGCDLSFRLCLLPNFAPERAADLYKKYIAVMWIDLGLVGGFGEWPRGSPPVRRATGRAKQDSPCKSPPSNRSSNWRRLANSKPIRTPCNGSRNRGLLSIPVTLPAFFTATPHCSMRRLGLNTEINQKRKRRASEEPPAKTGGSLK
jgi:hypothetical protein